MFKPPSGALAVSCARRNRILGTYPHNPQKQPILRGSLYALGQIPGLVERSAGAGIARQTILEVVGGSPGSKSTPAHHARDQLGGLVLDGILGVGHVAEGRHVDWVPMETMSSAFAIVLATRSPRTHVRSSIWGAVHRRLTEGDSTNFATCVSCRKARLPRGLPRGL